MIGQRLVTRRRTVRAVLLLVALGLVAAVLRDRGDAPNWVSVERRELNRTVPVAGRLHGGRTTGPSR